MRSSGGLFFTFGCSGLHGKQYKMLIGWSLMSAILQLSPVSEKEVEERLQGEEPEDVCSDPREYAAPVQVRDRAADNSRRFWCTFDRNSDRSSGEEQTDSRDQREKARRSLSLSLSYRLR